MPKEKRKLHTMAVVKWFERDEIAEAIHHELQELGYEPTFFGSDETVPNDVDAIFTFAPYGQFLPIVQQLTDIPSDRRPFLIHWNTEGLPDLRLPWPMMRLASDIRSWLERLKYKLSPASMGHSLLALLDTKLLRFRYVGDYYYAHRRGILNLFADSSAVYTQLHNQHGLPTLFIPWGSSPHWYAELNLERDIDVLWMGNRFGRRRSNLLDQVREELQRHGVTMYVADGEENPFIFREERISFLNRAKITLNITRTWYDDNFSRFALAAPNRSLIVSEQLLPHCPAYEAGIHYVATEPQHLAATIVYYLQQAEARAQIVDNAYQLSMTQLTFKNSLKKLLAAAETLSPANSKAKAGQ
jgi:hypothetical protein